MNDLNAFEVVIMKMTVTAAVLMILAVMCNGACSRINRAMNQEDDHFLEELGERLLESETGLDLDFTPGSAE